MTDELILTEELLTEFLDPVSAKAYEWKIESDYPATCKFQASFEDDNEKRYYLSFYRDSGLGKNARKVIFSVKKNKNLNPKINVDKGSFIKILGSIIQIYQAYKLNDADGKMSNSYGFQFPDSFAKYMPFVHKVIKRLFKTNPKIKLDLYGAVDSQENFTIMYYVNPSSTMPYFGGPKADLNVIRGEFFHTLTGETADSTSKGKTDTEVMSKVTASEPVQAYKKAYKFNVPKPDPEVVAVPKAVEPEPVEVKKDWKNPKWTADFVNFGGHECKADTIQMLIDSGSSSLKKDQTAKIYGLYIKEDFMECYKQFSINESAAEKIKNYAGNYVLVVNPITDSKKYVAFSVSHDIVSADWKDERFLLLGENEVVGLTTTVEPAKSTPKETPKSSVFSEPPKQKEDAQTFELPDSFEKTIANFETVKLGPVNISLTDDTSIIAIGQKLNEIKAYFGSLPKSKLNQTINDMMASSMDLQEKLNKVINKYLKENDLFFGTKSHEDSVYAVRQYTGSSYEAINGYLRNPDGDYNNKNSIIQKISHIDKGFETEGIRFPGKLNVYRGASISREQIKTLQGLSKIPLTGYASVSLRPSIAYSFANIDTIKAVSGFVKDEGEELDGQSISSKQGNKVLYSINRLDRCLSIAVKQTSNHPNEEEIILNRGTMIQMRKGEKLVKVIDRAKSAWNNDEVIEGGDGVWFAKTEIAPLAISESTMRAYLLREAIQGFSSAQDALAITTFFLADCKERLID